MNEVQGTGIKYPLVFAQHITNTRLLPWNTWCTTTLDIEWDWYRDTTAVVPQPLNQPDGDRQDPGFRRRRLWLPIPPDLLLTETVGRQTGTMGDSHFNILGRVDFSSGVPETYSLSEWGMRAVHELDLYGSDKVNEALWKFGYGTEKTRVVNYWSDDPPVTVNDPEINKWLLVERPGDKNLFLVLQTWNKADTEVQVNIDPVRLGFTPALKAWDVAGDEEIPCTGYVLHLSLPGPYGTRVIIIGGAQDE